ncbi:MAG: 3-hydroxyacyl-CoA dehydrogenase [Pseudomonadota bacterium]|nr:3-hydroxyacyl-CoA dehydrogenase/enoyl-CoA hydratase family protein [Pseudomonadota bacterium]QKK06488.1 MAG: 3-hydroxyacyl-CoA dehydrogenase [Pseudomonadota bacterium]
MEVKKAVVIGAGVMGAGIAAQLANAGIEVELLDIVPKPKEGQPPVEDRDVIAKSALARLAKDKPAALMHPKNARLIRPGNTEDHMDRLKDADLIIEAVIENPKIKSALFTKIDENRKPGAIVASNTSTIPLKDLVDGQSEEFKKDFMITHFFNPPRYMPLLELITSEDNDPKTVADLTRFMDEKMGKGVINCNDTPGFIANRIGTFWLQAAINEAFDRGIDVEVADALIGKPMGIPKTGVFALVDMVGLDLMPHISASLLEKLPDEDGYCKIHREIELIDKMIEDGYTGRKGKGGFYRLNTEGGKKVKEVIDLQTGEYHEATRPKPKASAKGIKKGLKAMLEDKSKEGRYSWAVLKQTLVYAAEHAEEVAGNITAVDDAMKMGYNWKKGPFELVDQLGADWFVKKLEAEGEAVPALLKTAAEKGGFYRVDNGKLQHLGIDGTYRNIERPEGVLLLSDVKRASKPVLQNKSAKVWDIGDSVLCLEFTSPNNSIDEHILDMMNKTIDLIEDKNNRYKGLVIHNEGDNFSVGANLKRAVIAVKTFRYGAVEKMVKQGQDTFKRLKYANFPVVGAPAGMALGGGCETLLHCDGVQAHAETYIGLVELGVGLIPAWGGCTEMLTRATQNPKMPGGPMPPVAKTFETIGTAKVSTSAAEAKDLLFLRKEDKISMNKQRLLADAKTRVQDMLKNGYTPEEPKNMRLPGKTGHSALNMAIDGFYSQGLSTPYDVVLADQLAEVLTGGKKGDQTVEMTQDEIRDLERQNFVRLIKEKRTFKRIMHMLNTNKPLREGPDPKHRSTHQLRAEMRKPSLFKRITSPFSSAAEKPVKTKPTCEVKPQNDAPKEAANTDKAPEAKQDNKPQAQPAATKDKKAGNKP